ncbi:50S ribosomal protein L21 [Patescibacteria group bacterium]|nr:50S ribosomal protein L21 [Patescibacteria group bacterium]
MFAVIKTGGKQYLVSVGDKIKIEKLDIAEGKDIVFDEVLLVASDKTTKIGTPLVKGATVKGKIIQQGRAKKVIVFRYKPKKRQQKKKGHRQPFSEVEITKISLSAKKSVS